MLIPPPSTPITIPEPSETPWLVVDDGDPPAPTWDTSKLLQILPGWARRGTAPMRDAFMLAFGDMMNTAWAYAVRTLRAQQSPRFAERSDLVEWGEERGLAPEANETVAEYRRRLLTQPIQSDILSLLAVVNALCIEATGYPGAIIEPGTDAAFISSTSDMGTDDWYAAFIQGADQRLWALDPDRSWATGGAYIVSASDMLIPQLWVLIPEDAGGAEGWIGSALDPIVYIGSVADSVEEDFIGSAPSSLMDRVYAVIDAARLEGVSLTVMVDPLVGRAV